MDEQLQENNGPTLLLHNGVPAILQHDKIRQTTAPELFDTGGGAYIAYADGWQDKLVALYPDGYADQAAAVAEQYGLDVSEPPSLWLLVAMTLEP
jgi:hypothetical protein